MYLKLFHGRKDPLNEPMDDWGIDGPLFKIVWIHAWYLDCIDVCYERDNMADLEVVNNCIYYDGVYYGDYTIFSDDEHEEDFQCDVFDPLKTKIKKDDQ